MSWMNFGSRNLIASKARSKTTSKISGWIQDRIGIYAVDDDSIQVMVTEVECNDPQCVPLETLVALLGKDARWTTKVLKPLNEVTQRDIGDLPLPLSWLSWETEQIFIKSNTEIYSWMTRISDEFETKLSGLTDHDNLQAIKIMARLITDLQFKSVEIDENMSLIPDPSLLIKDTAANTAISTMVPMRLKSVSESVQLLADNGAIVTNLSTAVSRTTEIDLAYVEARCPSEIAVSAQINQRSTMVTVTSQPPALKVDDSMEHSAGRSSGKTKILKLENTRNQFPLISSTTVAVGPQQRHKKGSRPRGCPCCDPNNIDNIIDRMIFLETPP